MKMNRMALFLVLAIAVCGCNGHNPEDPQDGKNDKSIVIIYENDAHCNLEGYPKLAAYRDAIRDADTSYVLTVSSRDFVQGSTAGSISKGEFPIIMMNSTGYDVVTPGNHEFDFKLPRFKEMMSMLDADVVSVNISDPQGNRLFPRYVIKECGKKKVAFLGVLNPSVEQSEFYSFFDLDGNRILSANGDTIIPDVQKAVDDARKDGADYVVLLSHYGEDPAVVNSIVIARSTTGIDVVLDGHTHSVYPRNYVYDKSGRKVLFTQTGSKFQNIGKLVITPEGTAYTTLIPLESYLQKSASVQKTLDEVNAKIEAVAGGKVGYCEKTVSIYDNSGRRLVRNNEAPAGNLVADAMRSAAGARIGMINGGAVRTDIKEGDVKYSDLVNVAPFGNVVGLYEIKGSGIAALLTRCTSLYPNENGSFPQVSGIRFTLDTSDGNKVKNIQVEDPGTGKYVDLDPDATYTVGTTDYYVEDNGEVIGEYRTVTSLMPDYESLIQYVSETLGGVISADRAMLQGRITIK